MTKAEFLKLMRFPPQWQELGMYPDELFEWQVSRYQPGHEEGSEHDRNGAFHWWLRSSPSEDALEKLLRLAFLDSDHALRDDVRGYIRKAESFNDRLATLDAELESRSPSRTD